MDEERFRDFIKLARDLPFNMIRDISISFEHPDHKIDTDCERRIKSLGIYVWRYLAKYKDSITVDELNVMGFQSISPGFFHIPDIWLKTIPDGTKVYTIFDYAIDVKNNGSELNILEQGGMYLLYFVNLREELISNDNE